MTTNRTAPAYQEYAASIIALQWLALNRAEVRGLWS